MSFNLVTDNLLASPLMGPINRNSAEFHHSEIDVRQRAEIELGIKYSLSENTHRYMNTWRQASPA
jgi:hypothetical protein